MSYAPGKRIKFAEEKRSYKIVAMNDRFVICTKPFNLRKTFVYTIVDLEEQLRGPDNMIFGPKYDYSDPVKATKAINELMGSNGITAFGISRRNNVKLNIEWVK